MSVELHALQALWQLGESDAETARRVLDEVGARADDVADAQLRTLWVAVEERVRSRRPLDTVALAVARERLEAESKGLTLRDARAGQLPMFGGEE